MSTHDPRHHTPDLSKPPADGQQGNQRSGHSWMMIACCIPMLIIAVVLAATGVVGVGFIFVALACAAMMALMMRGMGSGKGHDHS
jgi:Flp pilus assembly protein TadB